MPFEVEDTICVVRDPSAGRTGPQPAPAALVVAIPAGGCPARSVAKKLHISEEEILGVLVHHQIYSLDHHLQPGDQVAFLPADASSVIAALRKVEALTKSRAH